MILAAGQLADNQLAEDRIVDWSIRGLVNSQTGQLVDHALDNSRTANLRTTESRSGQLPDRALHSLLSRIGS